MVYAKGKKHYLWKGDNAGYKAIHAWIRRQKGEPQKCLHCGITNEEKRLEWANKYHKLTRNVEDYIPLCPKCHNIFDEHNKRTLRYMNKSHYLTFNGETLSITEWTKKLNMKRGTIAHRIYRQGWTIEQALTIKPNFHNRPNKLPAKLSMR